MNKKAYKICVTGIVQGVGFRPFVYRLAQAYNCQGWIANKGSLVEIWLEGSKDILDSFILDIKTSAPPAAQIQKITWEKVTPQNYPTFEIIPSQIKSSATYISPDLALCPQCQEEFFNKGDRRYHYPFINCTNCGPRYTIIRQVPYDRENTTMASFTMCPACEAEYENPANRRYHAQPNACPQCGPTLKLLNKQGEEVQLTPAALLKQGYILAVKSLGGFHLTCDAFNEKAITTLRERKEREAKPLALMAKDLATVQKYCKVSSEEAALLQSSQAPIVLLEQLTPSPLSPGLNPGLRNLGIMLPYTPLHQLLLQEGLKLLVMTSGNLSDEPIIYEDEEALLSLKNIADYFLLHNRPIFHRCDDSIVSVIEAQPVVLRRARGYVPLPVKIPPVLKTILALGGDLKNTFCLARGELAYLSPHMGDMEHYRTFSELKKSLRCFQDYFQLQPQIVAHDLHPGYTTSQLAQEMSLPTLAIQHHEAHLASCLVDNQFADPVLGLVCDGTGYGRDGQLWGFEFFAGESGSFVRKAHLAYTPLIGGDKTVKRPDRMALLYLLSQWGEEGGTWAQSYLPTIQGELELYSRLLASGQPLPLTSSCGRLFDAVSALLGLCTEAKYEGQGAMLLEALCRNPLGEAYSFKLIPNHQLITLSLKDMWPELMGELKQKRSPQEIAAKFHETLAVMIRETFLLLRQETGLATVALSGGVMQNKFLLSLLLPLLREKGFNVLTHSHIPPNDGGISLGQALIAGRLTACV